MALLDTTSPQSDLIELLSCDGLSVEHADGTTECEFGCALPHELHDHVAGCGEFEPPCPCTPDENLAEAWLIAA